VRRLRPDWPRSPQPRRPRRAQRTKPTARRPPRNDLPQWELEDIDLRRTWAQDLIPDLQEQNQRFDIAYLDPPYRDLLEGQPLVLALLHCFAAADLLTPAGLLFVQHPRQLDLPAEVDQIAVLRRRDYGNTTLSSYQNIAC